MQHAVALVAGQMISPDVCIRFSLIIEALHCSTGGGRAGMNMLDLIGILKQSVVDHILCRGDGSKSSDRS